MSQDNRRSCNWCGKRYKESSAYLSRYYCSRRCELIAQQRDPDNYEACLKANRIIRIAKWIFYTLVALGIIFGLLNTNTDTNNTNNANSDSYQPSFNENRIESFPEPFSIEGNPISEDDSNFIYEELDPENDQQFSERSKIHINDQTEQDSIENRKRFIRDSIDRRIKFVRDSLAQIAKTKEIQERQFQQWLVNIRNTYINSFVPEGMPWELKRKDGNIKSMTRIGNTFDFTINKKVTLSDIDFEQWQIIQDKTDSDRRILALLTKDRKYALIFSDEWDISTSRYQYKLACLATQSGDNTDTKIFSFSAKCQKEIIEYYNNNAPKRDQYPE